MTATKWLLVAASASHNQLRRLRRAGRNSKNGVDAVITQRQGAGDFSQRIPCIGRIQGMYIPLKLTHFPASDSCWGHGAARDELRSAPTPSSAVVAAAVATRAAGTRDASDRGVMAAAPYVKSVLGRVDRGASLRDPSGQHHRHGAPRPRRTFFRIAATPPPRHKQTASKISS